jgi:2-polyprenyl-3-methyl-5-hydroxy-6-metoxy-1,4-benzoquinol methylase
LQRNWDEFGRTDPLYAILAHPDKRGQRWDVAEFLATGIDEINELMIYVGTLGVPVPSKRALDFGCGAGRLTQALALHFTDVWGVDIAPSMIELAKTMNRHGARCHYVLNEVDDLRAFDDQSFDFIYSSIVLQHMRPKYAKQYLREFLRLLSADGLLVFQVPSARLQDSRLPDSMDEALARTGIGPRALVRRLVPRAWVKWYWCRGWRNWRLLFQRHESSGPRMEMYGIRRWEVERFVTRCGGRIVDVVPSSMAPEFAGFRYAVSTAKR